MLLDIATGLLLVVGAAGIVIGFVLLDSEGARKPRLAWVRAHGIGGVAAAALLAAALAAGPVRGAATGTEAFGAAALALFVAAAVLGPFAARWIGRARKLGGVAAAAHATIAVTGLVLLIAYVALG